MAYFPNGLFISLVFMSVLSGRNAVPEYFSSNYNYVRPLKHDFWKFIFMTTMQS